MIEFIIDALVSTVIVLLASYLLPKVHVTGFVPALITALVVALLNATLGILLRNLLAVGTLGIGYIGFLYAIIRLVVTAICIKIADAMIPGFKTEGFTSALIMAVLMAIAGYFLGGFGN